MQRQHQNAIAQAKQAFGLGFCRVSGSRGFEFGVTGVTVFGFNELIFKCFWFVGFRVACLRL